MLFQTLRLVVITFSVRGSETETSETSVADLNLARKINKAEVVESIRLQRPKGS